MELRYRLVNVFTRGREPLSGNPLCVFEDGRGFDDATMQVSNDGFMEDLLNVAALRTVAYGGEVFVTVPGRVPAQAPMAAILRF